jgi:hypothetical protein
LDQGFGVAADLGHTIQAITQIPRHHDSPLRKQARPNAPLRLPFEPSRFNGGRVGGGGSI